MPGGCQCAFLLSEECPCILGAFSARIEETMPNIPDDVFTEPEDFSPDTLANLGPLRHLAGEWESDQGVDINPKADGPERRVFREHIRMDPIDPQTNTTQP